MPPLSVTESSRNAVDSPPPCVDPSGDVDLVHQVVEITARTWPSHVDRDELVSAGMLGLVQAAERWRPATGVPFRAYAAQRIRGAVLDAARGLDPLGRDTRVRIRKAERAKEALRASLERDPTVEEVAAAIGCPIDRLRDTMAVADRAKARRLDATPEEHSGEGRLADHAAVDPLAYVEAQERAELVREAVAHLPERQRMVIVGIYLEGRTSESLAKLLGVTPSRVSQLHSQALRRLEDRLAFLKR